MAGKQRFLGGRLEEDRRRRRGEVAREGTRLAIKRSKMTVLKELEHGQGKEYKMVREFEDAAVDVAGFNGMKSVSIDVGFISNADGERFLNRWVTFGTPATTG